MKRFILGAVLGAIAALLSAVGHGGEASRTMAIDLSPGTSKVIGFDAEVGAAFIADPATADVNVLDSRTLFVLGIAPGITSLKVHDANGELLAAYAVPRKRPDRICQYRHRTGGGRRWGRTCGIGRQRVVRQWFHKEPGAGGTAAARDPRGERRSRVWTPSPRQRRPRSISTS